MLLTPVEFVRTPAALNAAYSRTEAERYTRWLATHHYENFHVVSFLLPRRLHQDFYNVYAYCRWADDLGDEMGDVSESLRLLGWWREQLDRMYAGEASHPVFVALQGTVARHGIPRQPFADLIRAFVQDQTVTRYGTWDHLVDYCRYSANPVGRLVLYLCGYSDAERQRLSDATCTALQLANFWQDVTIDRKKGRIYVPLETLERHGSSEAEVMERRATPAFRRAMRELVERAHALFLEGLPLARMVDRRLAIDLGLFSQGGLRVLQKIARQDYDVLGRRPSISKAERVGILIGTLVGQVSRPTSYAFCRRVARRRAKNFYYSFLLLSRRQRDQMCAVYAFMRHCDDLSDEPGASRESLELWRASLESAFEGRFDAWPGWPALFDTIESCRIPREYFRQMIEGVASDLQPVRIETFPDLYQYCYKVASVVGLTTIHIFGFESPEALPLAEKCGVAFQLTNILRDIREDAERGRVYLPAEDLRRFGVSEEDLRAGRRSGNFIRLMHFEAARGRAYYNESTPLVRMVQPRSRRALWALITIYSRLLERIEKLNYDVFSRRVSLSGFEKSSIVLRAITGSRAG